MNRMIQVGYRSPIVYDSEVAKGLVTEPWAPHSHLRLVALLRDLFWELVDHRTVTWIHVRSHGREHDPTCCL